MLKKIAAGLIAATMLAAPLLVTATSESAAATPKSATVAKPGIKTVKSHRKHARVVVRHGVRYMKIVRHGKVTWVRMKATRHHGSHVRHHGSHVKHVKRTNTPAKPAKPGAA